MGTLRRGQTDGLVVDAAANVTGGAVVVDLTEMEAIARAGGNTILLADGEAYPRTRHTLGRVALCVRGAQSRATRSGHAALADGRKIATQLACRHVAVLVALAVLFARAGADARAGGKSGQSTGTSCAGTSCAAVAGSAATT